jgi:hypothetical protein
MRTIDDQSLKGFIEASSLDEQEKQNLIAVIPGMTPVDRAELVINLKLQKASDDLQELEKLPINPDQTTDEEAAKLMDDYELVKKKS